MTRQESFKRRVRERMAKTGERYAAARQVLLEQAAARQQGRTRIWVSEPEMSSKAMQDATGKTHDQWCDIIEAWDGDSTDHPAVAAYLQSDWGLDGWWSQSVTVSYERIVGLRLPFQRSDGTFAVGKSKKVGIDHELLRKMLLDDDHRADLFPGKATKLQSKPTTKALRIGIGPGVAVFGIQDNGDGRTALTIQHEKLPTLEEVEEWRFYWSEWVEALEAATAE